jgi:hypothetical protein
VIQSGAAPAGIFKPPAKIRSAAAPEHPARHSGPACQHGRIGRGGEEAVLRQIDRIAVTIAIGSTPPGGHRPAAVRKPGPLRREGDRTGAARQPFALSSDAR